MTSFRPIHPVSSKTGITGIHIARLTNGFKVTHAMHGAPEKRFVFHDPTKMTSHINRAVNQQWLKPGVGREASRIGRSLNIG